MPCASTQSVRALQQSLAGRLLTSFTTAFVICAAVLLSVSLPANAAKQNNINIGFFLPYELKDSNSTTTDPTSISGNVIANDAAAELAVQDVNSNPNVLSNTNVNILRFNNWDPKFATQYTLVDSGGYSSVAAIKAVTLNNTAIAFGDYFSNTTSFTAEILSYYKVPFCGSTQDDPGLSDKSNFGSFFRTQPASAVGAYFVRLFSVWNVTRVSIIVGSDTFSSSYGDDISLAISTTNISVISKLIITPEMQNARDYSYPLGVLDLSDTRYFIIAAGGNLTADFYYAARDRGLTGSTYVWLGTSLPYVGTSLDDQRNRYGGSAIDDLQGYIYLKNNMLARNSKPVTEFTQRWTKLNAVNANKYPLLSDGSVPKYARASYDCVNVLLNGVDQVLAKNPSLDLLNITQTSSTLSLASFAKTGVAGYTVSTITISDSGDMITPMLFISVNNSVMATDISMIDQTYAFAMTDPSAKTFSVLAAPVFSGGGAIPPNDGSTPIVPTERIIEDPSALSILLFALEIIGLVMSGLSAIIYGLELTLRKKSAATPLFALCVVAGTVLVFVSIKLWAGRESEATCQVQRFLLPAGFALVYGAIFARLFHLSRCLENQFERARGVGGAWVIAAVGPPLVLNLIFAIVWSKKAQPYMELVNISKFEYFYRCNTLDEQTGNAMTYAFYALDGVIGLACVYLSHSLKKEHEVKMLDVLCKIAVLAGITIIVIPFLSPNTMLPRILRALFSFAIAFGTLLVIFIPSMIHVAFGELSKEKEDMQIIKSGIRSDHTFASTDAPILEVLSLGVVFFQTRGILGWSEAKKADMILHRRRGQTTITFSEISSYAVQAFNITNLILEASSTMSASAGAASNPGAEGDVLGGDGGEGGAVGGQGRNPESDREVVVTTKHFSVKITTSAPEHAAEIRALLFGSPEDATESKQSAAKNKSQVKK
ncbi:periplasmic binding protein-like I [Zopfochytrium polystomum]|nr:periplasmic binding protein-like I [Zopfochytrium polystomum]